MSEREWTDEHREQVRTSQRILGILLLAVATWRFLNWGDDPAAWDAGMTVLFFALGGAGAMPGSMAKAASLIIDALPWTANKGDP